MNQNTNNEVKMPKTDKDNNSRVTLNEKIHVAGVELIAGSSFLLVHEYNPHQLCLNVPNFKALRLHAISQAITFNAFNGVSSEAGRIEAKQKVLEQLTEEDIININGVFESAVANDYADYEEYAIDNEKLKRSFYESLVRKRQEYDFQDPELLNPSKLGLSNDEHLNAWSYWHGNLNADILLIGQDFGGDEYYKKCDGDDSESKNVTNERLALLFKEIDPKIDLSDKENCGAKLYFTNAVLGAKKGDMDGPLKSAWYLDTAEEFIKPLIELIGPKIIIAMGSAAYDTIARIYKRPKASNLGNIIAASPAGEILPGNIKLFAVYHCSNNGRRTRNEVQQKDDWQRIKTSYDQLPFQDQDPSTFKPSHL